MSDTPRTDAVASDGWSGDAECVRPDFARELEREINKLNMEAEMLRAQIRRLSYSFEPSNPPK